MHQEKYNLKWYTYSDHLKEMLHEMMKSDDLTDVTLVCDDKIQLKAHKIHRVHKKTTKFVLWQYLHQIFTKSKK